MRTVYRIVWPNGEGFYTGGGYHLMDKANDDYAHPCPWSDSQYQEAYDEYRRAHPEHMLQHHVFGFDSIASLRRWFYNDQWLLNMVQHGLSVLEYKVPDDCIIVGRAQVTFRKEESECVAEYSPLDILSGVLA